MVDNLARGAGLTALSTGTEISVWMPEWVFVVDWFVSAALLVWGGYYFIQVIREQFSK